MDNEESTNKVSLPGAGGAEPTILEVLSRNAIGECDNEVTAQQQQQQQELQEELHGPNADHRSDDISRGEINDNFQLDACYATSVQVTDLDGDDNEDDNEHVTKLEPSSVAEDSALSSEGSDQVKSEAKADAVTRAEDTISNSLNEIESAECDINAFDKTTLSEHNITCKLVDQERPLISNSEKRLSSVEEQSNESESTYSDENCGGREVIKLKLDLNERPWYHDDDLDPEDQRIIQEAVESILKGAKEQLVKDQNLSDNPEIASSEKQLTLPPQQTSYLLPKKQQSDGQDSQSTDELLSPSNSDYKSESLQDFSVSLQQSPPTQACSPEEPATSTDLEGVHLSEAVRTSDTPAPHTPNHLDLKDYTPSETISSDSGITSPYIDVEAKDNTCTDSTNVVLTRPGTVLENRKTVKEETSHLDDNNSNKFILSVTKPTNPLLTSSSASLPNESRENLDATLATFFQNFNSDSESHFHPTSTDIGNLSCVAKKEYYQRLRDYLNSEELDRPPVPLKTYQWEDLRRAKKQGGYPWTHLYKRPLGPEEEPELLTARRSQERQKFSSESPRSVKKVVRIHEEVLVKETERYISDLSDNETDEEDDRPEDQREEEELEDQQPQLTIFPVEDNFSVQSEPILSVSSDDKSSKITRIKGILKRRLSLKQSKAGSAPESRAEEATPVARKRRLIGAQRIAKCYTPIMNKLRSMADKQLKKRNIKKVPLKDNEKVVLSEKQKILKLRASPKADHSQIPHFIEKQDSDDILEILELEESPSKSRKLRDNEPRSEECSIPVPDEIIELPAASFTNPPVTDSFQDDLEADAEVAKLIESSRFDVQKANLRLDLSGQPQKAPRRRKEHIYEEVDSEDIESKIEEILQEAAESATRISQQIEEERLKYLQDEDGEKMSIQEDAIKLKIVEDNEKEELLDVKDLELKSALKRETSPSSDKRVTFSHTEDEAEPHREDISLPEEYMRPNRWSNTADHEYEPIGEPVEAIQLQQISNIEKEASPIPSVQISKPPTIGQSRETHPETSSLTSVEQRELSDLQMDEEDEHEPSAFEQQRELEERYFSSAATTPRTDSRTDNEIHTSQVDSSAIEELPLKSENRKKGFMASAQDRSRKVSQNIRSQAGKIKTKIRGNKKSPSGSPKVKDRKRFKKPDFSKIKMPEIKRPELPKFKTPEMPKFKSPEFKRPEFTKFDKPIFTKPDFSKFKIPDTVAIKLRRTRSLRETEATPTTTETSPEPMSTPKKKFDFNFGTYPRMLRKRKQKMSTIVIAKADDLPSTETPPSVESTTLPRQEGGPVSPRWTDKFSDVSYGDSESGKYQRYGSEVESLGRESSLEQRMKDDMERSIREQELDMLHSVEPKEFADYDEENRAIHEISKIREGEFKKRRPMQHQDSDLVSEESKEIGWSEKDAIRNAMLKRDEESEIEHIHEPEKYPSEEEGLGTSGPNANQETQSTASSGIRQKGVIEEIDDDEFVLRKRGISQDNIEIRQYISTAIREGLTTPINALAQLGREEPRYPNLDISNEQVDFEYDIPPPKPKRMHKHFNNFDSHRDTESREVSEEYDRERRESFDDNTSFPHSTDEYFAMIPPSRPLRKSKKQLSPDEDHEVPSEEIPYFEDEDENVIFKKMNIDSYKYHQEGDEEDVEHFKPATPPKAPKRRRKQQRESIEKDSYVNRFSGRSVSNSFLPSEERDADFIVYRTQHEYIIPLAQTETFTPPTVAPRRSRSRSQSHMTDDDRTSRGAESLVSESSPAADNKFHIDMKESDGYATVRKEPPPRPPAPVRHRKPSPTVEHFSTMPHSKKESNIDYSKRNFSTIGPTRPPRRKSSISLVDAQRNISSPDVTQYEELDVGDVDEGLDLDDRVESPRDLSSGDVINKMKYRPLPPPPRPPRESRKKERKEPDDYSGSKHDRDDGAEKIACDLQSNGDYDIQKHIEKCIEVEVSTQTDPLPDDFCCEEFEITEDMRIIEPRVGRTLQDILIEEQLRTDQLQADDDSFTRSLQRFREAGQRSFSERSRASTADRSRASHGSRPTTPNAIVLERKVPTPIPDRQGETMLEATILVLPIDDEDLEMENEEKAEVSRVEHEENVKKETSTEVCESPAKEERRLQYTHFHEESTDQKEAIFEKEDSVPIAPPRKRSSLTTEPSPIVEDTKDSTLAVMPPSPLELEPHPEEPLTRYVSLPNRLTLVDLEVERLSVNELQAGQITVSQLQSSQIKTDEFECGSSNTGPSLEIPPGLIDEIIRRVRSSERELGTTGTQTAEDVPEIHEDQPALTTPETPPPPRPPLPQTHAPPDPQQQQPIFPSEYMQYSIPPPSFFSLRDPSEGELHQNSTHRRRRHHRRRESSSEDDHHREHHRNRHGTRSPEPTVGQLGGQLLHACGSSLMQSMNHIVNILRSNEKEGTDRSISTAIVLVVLVTIGFLLLGISGNKNVHHHHWDYFNPPDHQGR